MKRTVIVGAVALVALAAVAAARFRPATIADSGPTESSYTQPASTALESAGLCPWRQPTADRLAFFPHSDRAEQRLLALGDLRPEILRRLGKGGVTDGNALYVYRIFSGGKKIGIILVQRAPGAYGAVEYVVGLTPGGRIVGLHIQSQREMPAIAQAIDAPAWRGAFVGKTANDTFTVGSDLPAVPADARQTATALATSVRRMVIETTVGLAHNRV